MRDVLDATVVLNDVLEWGYRSGPMPNVCQLWKAEIPSPDYFQLIFRVPGPFLGQSSALVGLHCHLGPGPAGNPSLSSDIWMELDELLGAGDQYRQKTVASDEAGVFWFTKRFEGP